MSSAPGKSEQGEVRFLAFVDPDAMVADPRSPSRHVVSFADERSIVQSNPSDMRAFAKAAAELNLGDEDSLGAPWPQAASVTTVSVASAS